MKGKAKIDFEKWYDNEFNGYEYLSHRIKRMKSRFHFWDMPNCFQQGVLREFFESKGIIMCSYKPRNESEYAFTLYDINSDWSAFVKAPDYSTAFTHAIDKACEIINGKKN